MAKSKELKPIVGADGVLLSSGQLVQVAWPQPGLERDVQLRLADRVGEVQYIEESGTDRGQVDVQFPAQEGYESAFETLLATVLKQAAPVEAPEPAPAAQPAAKLSFDDLAAGATAAAAGLRLLPLDLIDLVRNTRQHYDQQALEDLAQSIRVHGVFQNVVVRPSPVVAGRYQLAAGHRRFIASQMAGQTTIPAVERPLTDRQFLEIQLTENQQREKVEPADEAETFAELRSQGFSAEDIALSIGRTAKFVAQRAQLVKLLPEWAQALREHRLPLAGAHALASLSAEEQQQALTGLNDGYFGGFVTIDGERKRTYETDRVKRWVRDTLSRDLAMAAFPKDDAELVPAAGPCTTCPKRSGNVLYLFAHLGNDRCRDASCFQAKCDGHLARQAAKLQADLDQGRAVRITDDWNRQNGALSRSDYTEVTEQSRQPTDEERATGKVRQAIITEGRRMGEVVQVILNGNSVRSTERTPEEKAAAAEQAKSEKAATAAKNRQMRQAYRKLLIGVQTPGAVRLAVLRERLISSLTYTVTKDKRQALEQLGWPAEVLKDINTFSYRSARTGVLPKHIASLSADELLVAMLTIELAGWHTQEYDLHIPDLAKQLEWTPEQLDAEATESRTTAKAGKAGKEVASA